MKAMILAAGLGTRLRPLTDHRPKALVEIAGRTLLEITLSRLRSFGVSEVIINVHHFAEMILAYLKSNNNFGMRIEISREDVLLDTGGGLKKAAWFFLEDSKRPDEPFLLHNVDVISTIDLARMIQFHKDNKALATLAVRDRETSRYLLFNEQLQLCGRIGGTGIPACAPTTSSVLNPSATAGEFSRRRRLQPPRNAPQAKRASAPEVPLQALAFSGIHVISPRLLPMITEEGVFSIIPTYLRLAAQGEKILAFRADEYYWRDLGRPADLAQAAQDLQQKAPL
jgi:mannose-1-phosphate guanylyltransferase